MENSALTNLKIAALSQSLPEWEVNENRLKRTFRFRNFIESFSFMTQVALTSEALGHHPDWRNVYGEVTITLTTHDLDGLSELDFKLAHSINELTRAN